MSVKLSELLSDINERVRSKVSGTLDNNKRVRAFNRVLGDLQDFADWEFTKRTKEFYFIDGVSEYSLKNYVGCTMQDNDGSTSIADFKNPFDLRIPDKSHIPFGYRDIKEVRNKIRQTHITNEYGIDNDLLVINYYRQSSAELHNCDSLTANGTWTASSDATNLTIDEVKLKTGSGSLNFDVSGGTSLVLTNPDFNVTDLEALQNESHLVMWVYLPTITNFTSIKAEWGDDASNNWNKTETVPAGNDTLQVGWNRFAFRWADATETGSPTVTSVNFLQVTLTYSAATTDTDFRIDDIRIGKEVTMELDYYSLAMVKDADGDYQREFNPSDVTQTDELLGPESKKTLIEGTAYELFEITGGKRDRDSDNSVRAYAKKQVELLKRCGHRIRRPTRVLNFQRRR